ncbi:hypothetical protein SFUMM280S_11504 [Streptomyces fumanus]
MRVAAPAGDVAHVDAHRVGRLIDDVMAVGGGEHVLGADPVTGHRVGELREDVESPAVRVRHEIVVVVADQGLPLHAAVALVPHELHDQLGGGPVRGVRRLVVDGRVVEVRDQGDEVRGRRGVTVEGGDARVGLRPPGVVVEVDRIAAGDRDPTGLLDLVERPVGGQGTPRFPEKPQDIPETKEYRAYILLVTLMHTLREPYTPCTYFLPWAAERGGHTVEVRDDVGVDLFLRGVVVDGEVDRRCPRLMPNPSAISWAFRPCW